MKRASAGILWFMSGWTFGEFLVFVLPAWGIEISPALGPILGTAAAAIIAGDPRRLIWSRSTAAPAAAGASRKALQSPV